MMKKEIRDRLSRAIEMKGGVNLQQVSNDAGLGDTYLYDVLNRGSGTFERLEKIANVLGIRWEWLKTGEGDIWTNDQETKALDRASILVALETIFAHFVDADEGAVRFLAEEILAIVEQPPDGMTGTDKLSRIRIGISGALRLFARQQYRGNTE
jgi:lambda repressor-like predicted transcriptional regulator